MTDLATFRAAVVARMADEGDHTPLSSADESLLLMAIKYGIGPVDCACQIIDNRDNA